MLNLIRMNLFRLVHTKSAIVVFCLLMGFSVLSSCISAYDQAEQKKAIEEQKKAGTWEPDFKGELTPEEEAALQEKAAMEEAQDNTAYDAGYELGSQMSSNIGIYVSTPVDNNGNLMDYLYLYCEELGSGILLLFILIGAVLFFRGDEKNGFLKNIAGQTKHRYNIFFSKLVVIAIYTFVCMACYMAIGFVAYKISWIIGVNINLGMDYIPDAFNVSFGVKHIPEVLGIFALEYLLYMAFTSGLLLITEITKSTAAAITMGMCGMMGFGVLFAVLVRKVFNTDFDISKYYISTSISNVYPGADRDIVILALIAGIIFFIIYNVLNIVWFSRKDIV